MPIYLVIIYTIYHGCGITFISVQCVIMCVAINKDIQLMQGCNWQLNIVILFNNIIVNCQALLKSYEYEWLRNVGDGLVLRIFLIT